MLFCLVIYIGMRQLGRSAVVRWPHHAHEIGPHCRRLQLQVLHPSPSSLHQDTPRPPFIEQTSPMGTSHTLVIVVDHHHTIHQHPTIFSLCDRSHSTAGATHWTSKPHPKIIPGQEHHHGGHRPPIHQSIHYPVTMGSIIIILLEQHTGL